MKTLNLHIQNHNPEEKNFRLWLPLFILWPFFILFAFLISIGACLYNLITLSLEKALRSLQLFYPSVQLYNSLCGFEVRVTNRSQNILIKIT